MIIKTNEYTGREYECSCDYSYTCDNCAEIRLEFRRQSYENELREWTVASMQKIATALNIQLEAPPEKPNKYD